MDANKQFILIQEDIYKNTIFCGNTCEYDKPLQNSNIISETNRGNSMQEDNCRQMELKKNGMQVILKFPKESEQEEQIKKEVKEILFQILQEKLANNHRKGEHIV